MSDAQSTTTTTTTRAEVLAELRRQLLAAEATSPELLRPLRQARASVERALGLAHQPTSSERHNGNRAPETSC